MKSILIGLYILLTEFIYVVAIFVLSYFFVKFFWNKEKIKKDGKIKIIVKEKPIKKRVLTVFSGLMVILLVTDILCVICDLDVVAATRVYPFDLEKTNKEGIYPRFLYNMQVMENEQTEKEVKFNLLFFYNYNEAEKTKARDNLKKNKVTYFDEIENKVYENLIENTTKNVTYENVIENVVENLIENTLSNKVS